MESENIPRIKLIFLGDVGVGKSSIMTRYLRDSFSENYQATIGLDFILRTIKIKNKEYNLAFYDTAGQEKFRSLIPMYIRDAKIILLVYDITKKESFDNLNIWLESLKDIKEDIILYIVGNKSDMKKERQVLKEEGKKFAKEKNFGFKEVSAKTGDGIKELFEIKIINEIKHKMKIEGAEKNIIENNIKENNIELKKGEELKNNEKKFCCF